MHAWRAVLDQVGSGRWGEWYVTVVRRREVGCSGMASNSPGREWGRMDAVFQSFETWKQRTGSASAARVVVS